jgi:L-threonylcarbamoyladenylate synthase
MNKQYQKAVEILKRGGIVVMPADTVYGTFASALNKKAVEKLYALRHRKPEHPFIIVVASIKDLKYFNIQFDKNNLAHSIFAKGGISAVLPSPQKVAEKFRYLGEVDFFAFRIPSQKNKRGRALKKLLEKTGPLVAPSANLEGGQTVQTIQEARQVFDNQVDLYISNGRRLTAEPSTLIKLVDGKIKVLRGRLK